MYAPVVTRFTTYGIAVPPRIEAYMGKIWALPGMQTWRAAAQKEVDAGIA
jgi:glutathione S-transferase